MAKKGRVFKGLGGKSLSDLRKSIGLDKDKSKASTTKKERDKNLPYDYQKDIVERASVDETGPNVVVTLNRGNLKSDYKAPETPSTFVEDLKDAYKSGLFTGGTKTKNFMDKYGLTGDQIRDLRVGIDQGLGIRIGSGGGGNILQDVIRDLRDAGTLSYSDTRKQPLFDKAEGIFEPGMTKYDRDPMTGILGMAPLVNLGIKGMDLIAGGSEKGLAGLYYGREKGLTGDELENFAAAVANDDNLYNQMMTTDEMQKYQLEKFRTDTIKEAMNKRQGQGDPNPISGTQPGEEADEGESDTDTGSGTFTPAPQNFYTFFDPNLGRYRSGTYDEYLQYVTAKDGGIIQLQQGGALPNAPGGVLPQGRKTQLEDLFQARKEIQNLDTPTKSEAEGSRMIMADIDDKAKALSDKSKEGIMMAMTDQPAKDLFMANNPNIGPALRKDLKPFQRAGDSVMSLFMEAIRKGDITEGSANQFLEEALNNFVAAGIIPPNTSYDQLTDPFKDLVTREAAMIANSMAKPIDYLEGRDMESMQLPNMSFDTPDRGRVELPMTILRGKEGDESMIRRSTSTQDPTMYNVADGGIIGLKQGGMNDMMQADELMFKDPSDKEEWEYNV
jgi:hypothetical protein